MPDRPDDEGEDGQHADDVELDGLVRRRSRVEVGQVGGDAARREVGRVEDPHAKGNEQEDADGRAQPEVDGREAEEEDDEKRERPVAGIAPHDRVRYQAASKDCDCKCEGL